jgi:D-alanyl-D-alanine carboxypeptidase
MISRRSFVTLGAGLTASLFATGHARLRPTVSSTDSAALVGPDLPVNLPANLPVDLAADPAVDSLANQIAPAVSRGSYSPPIAGLHPDNMILEQVALAPLDPLPPPDVILGPAQRIAFDSALSRLRRLQNYVGYGNFNIIGWDQSLKLARNLDVVGAFTADELELIEELFFADAQTLGFYGDKVVTSLSSNIASRDIVKIPRSGHFLFKGDSTATYNKIRRDLGDSVILTSGIRSVVKQIYLFMNKAEKVDGNLSLASYSLAPPGHSYHAVGDFDVGKKGFGHLNFSEEFAKTDEFKRLIDLGYLDIRYPQQNPFGVRYEPWHIKVV